MARAQTYEPETPMSRDEFLTWVKRQPSAGAIALDPPGITATVEEFYAD
jgi:hypothetical protein